MKQFRFILPLEVQHHAPLNILSFSFKLKKSKFNFRSFCEYSQENPVVGNLHFIPPPNAK